MNANRRLFACWTVAVAGCVAAILTPPASASSGTLVVTSNATLAEDHYGNILINASSLTLDCDGHTVFGPGTTGFNGGIEIAANLTGVIVRRCGVTGFTVNGIFGGGGASSCLYEGNTLYKNGNHGMHLDVGTGYVVLNNKSYSNGGIGIVLTGAARSSIVHNTVEQNSNWAGIGLLNGSHDNVVVANTADRNAIGFVLDNATTNKLRFNAASANSSHGFVLIRGASQNVIQSNTAIQNFIGFEITQGSNSNKVESNSANGNMDDGFKFVTSNQNRVTDNTGNENGGIGFAVFIGASSNIFADNNGHRNGLFDALDDRSGTGNIWIDNSFDKTSGIAMSD